MKYSKTSLIFLLFALLANTANANIYKCKKSNGATHYSDKPCTKGLKHENIKTLKKSKQGAPASKKELKPVKGSSSRVVGTWSCKSTGAVFGNDDVEQNLKINADGSFLEIANVVGTTLGTKGNWKKNKNILSFPNDSDQYTACLSTDLW